MARAAATPFRRLPIYLVLDTSAAMDGPFQVTLREGLGTLQHEIAADPLAARCAYLAQITCGGRSEITYLAPAERFMPVMVHPIGGCMLGRALSLLSESILVDLIEPQGSRPGDYKPLVFLIVGNPPGDAWQAAAQPLLELRDSRQPLVVSLALRPEVARALHGLTPHSLMLEQPAEAIGITRFFFWIARIVGIVSEAITLGEAEISFPELPYGIVPA